MVRGQQILRLERSSVVYGTELLSKYHRLISLTMFRGNLFGFQIWVVPRQVRPLRMNLSLFVLYAKKSQITKGSELHS